MNRQQAEHILDAYIELELDTEGTTSRDAIDALRDVILDAMTEYKSTSNPWTITYPPKPLVTYTTADKMPTVQATCAGIDPAFSTTTAHGTVYVNGHVQGVGE